MISWRRRSYVIVSRMFSTVLSSSKQGNLPSWVLTWRHVFDRLVVETGVEVVQRRGLFAFHQGMFLFDGGDLGRRETLGCFCSTVEIWDGDGDYLLNNIN